MWTNIRKITFDEKFVHVIQGVTGYLRRQKNLIAEMRATCPRFINTRWLSMAKLLNWLHDKRERIFFHLTLFPKAMVFRTMLLLGN